MPDLTKVQPGLAVRPFGEKHLYHKSLAPVVVYTQADYDKALEKGYSEKYVHQEYPKHVDGKVILSADEEAALKGDK